jgi:flagellar hook-length control protein FliK
MTDAGAAPASADQPKDSAPDTSTAPASLPLPEPAAAPTQTAAPANPVASVPVVATADAAGTPAPRPVVHQVIPEVTRLVTTGEGVHRVTLELNPKALGEVKVVLTVRNGDVHVRLAAGSEAREALAHSAAELTRALEHIGVKDHRLTLAELPGVAASASTQTFSDTTEQQGQNASFTGRFDTEHHHDSRQPRMDDGSTATDGTDHEHGSRTRGDRSIHEVSHVPSRGGVDLRM